MKKIYLFALSVTAFGSTTVFSQQRVASVYQAEKNIIQRAKEGSDKQQPGIHPTAAADFTPTIWDDNSGKPGSVIATGTAFTVAQIDTSVVALKLIGSPAEARYNVVGTFSSPAAIPNNQIFWAGFTMNYAAGDSAGLITSNDTTPGDAPGTTGDFLMAKTHTFEEWSAGGGWHSFNDGTNQTWQLDIAQAIFPAVTLLSGADTITTHLNTTAGHTPKLFKSDKGGFLSGQNGYNDIAKAQKFDASMGITSGGTISSILFWFGAKIESGNAVNELPSESLSLSNMPNPAPDFTIIKYVLKKTSDVNISVFDITGKEVISNSQGIKSAGTHSLKIDVSNLNAGMYLYTLTTDNVKMTHKMAVAK